MQNGRKGSYESRVTLGRAVVSEQGASGPSLWLTFALELLGSTAPPGGRSGSYPGVVTLSQRAQEYVSILTTGGDRLQSSPGDRRLLDVWAASNKPPPFVRIEMAKSRLRAEVWTEMVSRFFAPYVTCWEQLGAAEPRAGVRAPSLCRPSRSRKAGAGVSPCMCQLHLLNPEVFSGSGILWPSVCHPSPWLSLVTAG